MSRKFLIEIISGLLILLFVYAAVTKLLDFNGFHLSIEKSPLIGSLAGFIPWFIPATELFISYLLFRPETRKSGLKAAFALMSVFSLYIAYILLFVAVRPCGCGGVLQKLSWPQHLVFNIFFTVIALLGILLSDVNFLHTFYKLKSHVMKKYFIGVLAIVLALGGSAFTKFGSKAAGDVYGELVAGHYQRLNNPYNAANCQNLTTNPCAFVVTAAGASHVTMPSYGMAAMGTFLANGWVAQKDNNTGLYTGN